MGISDTGFGVSLVSLLTIMTPVDVPSMIAHLQRLAHRLPSAHVLHEVRELRVFLGGPTGLRGKQRFPKCKREKAD